MLFFGFREASHHTEEPMLARPTGLRALAQLVRGVEGGGRRRSVYTYIYIYIYM
jgi:hypothetical protein